MPKVEQRDWVIEAGDKLAIGSDAALSSIVARLPISIQMRLWRPWSALTVIKQPLLSLQIIYSLATIK